MAIEFLGWDLGGAHLKAVALDSDGSARAAQEPTPLWQGLEELRRAIAAIRAGLEIGHTCRHALTMTGELADSFCDRETGVSTLIEAFLQHFPARSVAVYAGPAGFLRPGEIDRHHLLRIASANWLATATWVARRVTDGMLVDVGSTTSDLVLLGGGRPAQRGHTDTERLRYDELIYTGVVRTALMALARRAPWHGEWTSVMAEHFATTGDVYRITGELPEHADQHPSADGAPKTVGASCRRLARMIGCDADAGDGVPWQGLARYFRECQLSLLQQAWQRQLSRGLVKVQCPVVGAGVGRFLVQELAARMGHPYQDIAELFPSQRDPRAPSVSDCAPAAAVACLLREAS